MRFAPGSLSAFHPAGTGYEGVLAIRGDADGVKLYFNRGKELPNPEKLLQDSGGQVRSIDVEGASTLARPAVAPPDRPGHRSQPRAVLRAPRRVGGHSFDIGQAASATSPCLTCGCAIPT